jgi:hypothetical protein
MMRSFGLPHKDIQAFPILLHPSPVASSWFNIFLCRKLQPECGPNLMASSLEDLPMWLAVQATHNEPGSSLKGFHDPAVRFLVEHRLTNVFSSSQAILYSLDYCQNPICETQKFFILGCFKSWWDQLLWHYYMPSS